MPRVLSRPVIKHPHLVGWIVLVTLLGIWGTVAGPLWNPQPMTTVLIPETEDTAIGLSAPSTPIGKYEVEISTVEIELSDRQKIQANVRRPLGYEGLAPAMLFIHGTGTQSHTNFHREAQAITSTGIVTIVPDKRTDDYTLTHRDYEKLAEDYSDVFDYLLSLEGVDTHRSGVYAVSEGCFIAPVVAVTNPTVSYVALISAPVLPIREQGAWAADTYLRTLNVPTKVLSAIPRLIGQEFDTDTFEYIDFDVSSYHKRMTQPVFMAYGTGDISMPIIQAPLSLIDDVKKAGNENVTIRYYAKADHGLQIGNHTLLLSAMQDVADWVSGLPFTAHSLPHIAGTQPTQTYVADTVSRTHWFASGKINVYIPAGGVILIIFSLVTSGVYVLARRVRSAPMQESDQREEKRSVLPIARINIASIVLIIAAAFLLAYILAVAYLATNYTQNNFVTYGGWIALRILALVAAWLSLVAFSKFFVHYRRMDAHEWGRMPLVIAGTALLGQIIFLMALAYWGVFPSLI